MLVRVAKMRLLAFVTLFPGQVLVVVARQRSRLEPTGTTAASVTGPVRVRVLGRSFFANLRGTVSGSLWRGADVNYARAVDFCARDVTPAYFCCRGVSLSLLAALPGLALVQRRLALCVAEKPMVVDEWTLSKTDSWCLLVR